MVSHASEPQRCVRQVRNCGSLDVLWFVWVGPTSFKYGLTVKYEITKKKIPRCKHAHSFRIFFWNSASWPPLFLPSYCFCMFSMHLTRWNFQCIDLIAKVLSKIRLNVSQALFLWLCHFQMNVNIQNSGLFRPHCSSTYRWQFFYLQFHGKG